MGPADFLLVMCIFLDGAIGRHHRECGEGLQSGVRTEDNRRKLEFDLATLRRRLGRLGFDPTGLARMVRGRAQDCEEGLVYRNILIATDGSEVAGRAVVQGLGLAKSLGACVIAVTVTDGFPAASPVMLPTAADVDRYKMAAAETARSILDRVADAASDLGVRCERHHVADALPADGIIDACREHGCDLIVMATHGRRGMDRLLVGSQAAKVMTASSVPVLICR
jgi:nucleotide-binding universal stress UspA family protein